MYAESVRDREVKVILNTKRKELPSWNQEGMGRPAREAEWKLHLKLDF